MKIDIKNLNKEYVRIVNYKPSKEGPEVIMNVKRCEGIFNDTKHIFVLDDYCATAFYEWMINQHYIVE